MGACHHRPRRSETRGRPSRRRRGPPTGTPRTEEHASSPPRAGRNGGWGAQQLFFCGPRAAFQQSGVRGASPPVSEDSKSRTRHPSGTHSRRAAHPIEGDAARDVRARDTNQRRTLRSDAEDDAGDARGLSVTGCHVCRPHHAVRDPGRLGRRRAGGPGRRRHGRREASISAAHGAGSIPRAVSGAGGSAVPSAAATPGATAAAPRGIRNSSPTTTTTTRNNTRMVARLAALGRLSPAPRPEGSADIPVATAGSAATGSSSSSSSSGGAPAVISNSQRVGVPATTPWTERPPPASLEAHQLLTVTSAR